MNIERENKRCASYCTAETYDLLNLGNFLEKDGLEVKNYGDLLHVTSTKEEETRDIFCFSFGSLVFWGFNKQEEQAFIEWITPQVLKSIRDTTYDRCFYDTGEATVIHEEDDFISLETEDVDIKKSFSYGMAQSVKLKHLESEVTRTIDDTKNIPKDLAKNGKISLSRGKISKLVGKLFLQRSSINLEADILDTPEFLWKRPHLEHYYEMATTYLDIDRRIDIMNKRMEMIQEIYQVLTEEVNHKHSSFLEWVIIILIAIEILLVVMKDVLGWL